MMDYATEDGDVLSAPFGLGACCWFFCFVFLGCAAWIDHEEEEEEKEKNPDGFLVAV
jgi:hypothetical protein